MLCEKHGFTRNEGIMVCGLFAALQGRAQSGKNDTPPESSRLLPVGALPAYSQRETQVTLVLRA